MLSAGGATLGKLGILQSGDCTQWGIHSYLLLKESQTNKHVWVDGSEAPMGPDHLLPRAELHEPPWKSLFLQQQFSPCKKATRVLKTRRRGREARLKAFFQDGDGTGREEPTEDMGVLGVRSDMTGNPHGGQSQKRTEHLTLMSPPPPKKRTASFYILNIKRLHCSSYVLIPITVQKRSYFSLQPDIQQRNNVETGTQRSPSEISYIFSFFLFCF